MHFPLFPVATVGCLVEDEGLLVVGRKIAGCVGIPNPGTIISGGGRVVGGLVKISEITTGGI